MTPRTIDDWTTLAATDPGEWKSTLANRLASCTAATATRVLCAHAIPPGPSATGPLAGVPFVVKDLFDWRGHPTRCGSLMPDLARHRATRDAEILRRFEAMGAACCGKTQLNEFAYGLSGENPHFGDCPNPLDPHRHSGGSSSGSAWMVAKGIVPIAIGTDTGGSIRVPAAWCGVFGIRWMPGEALGGCHPLAAAFDTAGWFTATAGDMAASIRAWFQVPDPDAIDLHGTCTIPPDFVDPGLHQPFAAAMAGLGLRRNDALFCPTWPARAATAFNILQSHEAFQLHRERLERDGHLYDPAVHARLIRGRDWTSTDLHRARAFQAELGAWFDAYFRQHHLLCLPACPGPAPRLGEATPELREKTLALTAMASLTGRPVLTIPVRLDASRSVGIQCILDRSDPAVPMEILRRLSLSKASVCR